MFAEPEREPAVLHSLNEAQGRATWKPDAELMSLSDSRPAPLGSPRLFREGTGQGTRRGATPVLPLSRV